MQPALEVSPQQVLVGDPISIKVTGLSPGEMASLRVSGQDQFGNSWSSQASFQADAAGTVDTSRDAPTDGSYQGVDQAGLFWSMVCTPASEMVSPFAVMNYTVSLFVGGEEVDSLEVQRLAEVDLEKENLSDPVVGVFITPKEVNEPTPALIVLGGSEGGYNEGWARVIASKTRMPTLALAYFGAPGLSQTLENIPLEIIEKAIAWLNQQEVVAKDRIGVVGASRGGELAMLAASLFPQVKAVVGYTPSGVIWGGIGEGDSPAWTYRGEAFPYLRMMVSEEQQRLFLEAQKNGTPYLDAPSFEYSLEQQSSLVEKATIPVERSQAAFLLIGNPGDGVWPSDKLSRIAIDRLDAHGHPRTHRLLSYEDGGHMLIAYPFFPTTMRQFYLPTVNVWEGLGGTAEGAARAAEDSWPKVVEFLRDELGI
ncbi:MAG: acyl-CoA thioesterase/BAAT N-terminal domain-containing protein [Actinobacteria bacterium]|nr:acyl-CoA thioesterase/BAAT N-terminal domain-containing protein [Actinomycetota bacterium]